MTAPSRRYRTTGTSVRRPGEVESNFESSAAAPGRLKTVGTPADRTSRVTSPGPPAPAHHRFKFCGRSGLSLQCHESAVGALATRHCAKLQLSVTVRHAVTLGPPRRRASAKLLVLELRLRPWTGPRRAAAAARPRGAVQAGRLSKLREPGVTRNSDKPERSSLSQPGLPGSLANLKALGEEPCRGKGPEEPMH